MPQALAALQAKSDSGPSAAPGPYRHFARTAGDEIQGLFDSSQATVAALRTLARLDGWRVGLGLGAVTSPVPDDVRAASGDAFVAARAAVQAAHGALTGVVVQGEGPWSDGGRVARIQAALDLVQLVWRRRTDTGWQACELAAGGMAQRDIAEHLGISASAVSQRLSAAAFDEVARGEALLVWLLDDARGAHPQAV